MCVEVWGVGREREKEVLTVLTSKTQINFVLGNIGYLGLQREKSISRYICLNISNMNVSHGAKVRRYVVETGKISPFIFNFRNCSLDITSTS